MTKKYLGDVSLPSFMNRILSNVPSKEISDSECKKTWKYLGIIASPTEAIANWSYALDEANGTVTLQQYTGSETDVTVYGAYLINNKKYYTKLSCSSAFKDKTAIKTITFNEGVDTSECTDMDHMFNGCNSLTTINGLENLDTSKVTNMQYMFADCTSLTSLDIHTWNTSNVTNMNQMFRSCKTLTSLDLTSFNVSNVTSMYQMFYNCNKLTSLDLRNWDISKVTNMNQMFSHCYDLKEIKVTNGKWVIPIGCYTPNMFKACGVSSVTYYD